MAPTQHVMPTSLTGGRSFIAPQTIIYARWRLSWGSSWFAWCRLVGCVECKFLPRSAYTRWWKVTCGQWVVWERETTIGGPWWKPQNGIREDDGLRSWLLQSWGDSYKMGSHADGGGVTTPFYIHSRLEARRTAVRDCCQTLMKTTTITLL